MPNKHNEDRRHHIAKKSMKVTNWSEYNAGLRGRGSLTLWITEEAMAAWQAPARLTRGGQAVHLDEERPRHPAEGHSRQQSLKFQTE